MVTPVKVAWGVIALVVGIIFVAYLNVAAQSGDVIMPLDDTYIHFQYARQLANGEPYVYNPGDPPTSGATSFLYPYILAFGYLIGFTGLKLGIWAMLIGCVLLTTTTILLFQIGKLFNLSVWAALFLALTFPLTGAFSWHFMSGMETGLMITLTIATLYTILIGQTKAFAIIAGLLAITRPEGGILALIATVLLMYQYGRNRWFILPVIAIFVQPTVNFLLTGSPSSTGGEAKSILGTVPFYWDVALERIVNNFLRFFRELLLGGNEHVFVNPLFALLAALGLVLLWRNKQKTLVFIVIGWIILVGLAIATLDTAFWHFKRYQMPLIALTFPLVIISIGLLRRPAHQTTVITGLLLILALLTSGEFLRLYDVNIKNVLAQPYPMAIWLRDNTPPNSIIAVHDVGMMRYIGERHTLDMVGLTTPGAANYWRNGPGAVAEFVMNNHPNYIAAYTTARGLNYLAQTDLYGHELVHFTAEYAPQDNVALGAEFQGIYQVTLTDQPEGAQQASTQHYGVDLITTIDVADIESEQASRYKWENRERVSGFATEAYQFSYVGCDTCRILDGGRRINGSETFTIAVDDLTPLVLITRLHLASQGTLKIYANNHLIGTRWIPSIPGNWLEIATMIPVDVLTPQITIRIESDGIYMPYHHWIYTATTTDVTISSPIATFQNGVVSLLTADWHIENEQLILDLNWAVQGQPIGDYKLFIHIYDDITMPPITQYDNYAQNGTMPLGNWLPGVISDQIMVDLKDIPAGIYQVAIGFYEAGTFTRLTPDTYTDETRVFIGEIDVE
ncbi:MAG: hypothetical protein Kow00117_02970 [Phototrophicales bacterium]